MATKLHFVAILGEIWGPLTNLSKLHSKFRKHWSALVCFQLLSSYSCVLVFESPRCKDDVLANSFNWFGNVLVRVSTWQPFLVPEWVKPKSLPVWFGLPQLPFEFMDLEVLKSIGDNFGNFLTSKFVLEEGKVLVKICVLVSPSSVCPISCNLKSNDGICKQPIMKMNDDLCQNLIIADAPLFFNFRTRKTSINCKEEQNVPLNPAFAKDSSQVLVGSVCQSKEVLNNVTQIKQNTTAKESLQDLVGFVCQSKEDLNNTAPLNHNFATVVPDNDKNILPQALLEVSKTGGHG